jgi:hypothetical protein
VESVLAGQPPLKSSFFAERRCSLCRSESLLDFDLAF